VAGLNQWHGHRERHLSAPSPCSAARNLSRPVRQGGIFLWSAAARRRFCAPAAFPPVTNANPNANPRITINVFLVGSTAELRTRGITADTALRLARYFGNSPAFWMNLQTHYDLEVAEDKIAGQVGA
jgi:hypothetical protein